jgi:nucleosome assembly protein 1-like 1
VINELSDFTKLEPVEGQIQAEVNVKGVPGFWRTALVNNRNFADLISERDDEALASLIDIKVSYLEDNPGFVLEFVFSENEFFSNTVLTKKYYLTDADGEDDDIDEEYILDRTEGTPIEWKEGKDLSFRVEVKKQRHKNTNKTRVVKRTVPCETFFNFFKSQKLPTSPEEAGDMDEDEAQMLEQKLQLDYQIGEEIKDEIVPLALRWFTGEADDDMDSLDYDGMDESDMDSPSDLEDDEVRVPL